MATTAYTTSTSTSATADTSTTTVRCSTATAPPVAQHCGCLDCTPEIWNTDAFGHTCGARIIWKQTVEGGSLSEVEACEFVSNEFPTLCGPQCRPSQCDGQCTASPTPAPTLPPGPALTPTSTIYCFPDYQNRERYTNPSCATDYIQCLPNNLEVRINLWNMADKIPDNIMDHHRVVVVIDDFTYTPSGETHVADGGACSKHCQCSDTSNCLGGLCVSTRI